MASLTATETALTDLTGPHGVSRGTAEKLALALGCVKVGMGLGEIIAPKTVTRWTGRRHIPVLTQVKGLRRVATGVGILTEARALSGSTRVGRFLSLAAMVTGTVAETKRHKRSKVAMAAVAGATVAGLVIVRQLNSSRAVRERSLRFAASTSIHKTAQECYSYWRDIGRFPEFFEQVKSVQVTGDRTSRWIASGPAGKEISWDSEITEDLPGEAIAWRSLQGTPVAHSGSVRFEPMRGGQGTIVRLRMVFELPFPAARAALSGLLGHDPGFTLSRNLRRFKSILEAGEIASTEGQPSGRASGATHFDRMARI